MDKNIMKLNDYDLENVNGGTVEESGDLVRKLRTLDSNSLHELLKNTYGIGAELRSTEGNKYWDIYTGDEMSHEEVLKKIIQSKGRFKIPF